VQRDPRHLPRGYPPPGNRTRNRSGRRSRLPAPAIGHPNRNGLRSRRARSRFEPCDEIVEAQLLQALAPGLELGGAQLDERAALLAQLDPDEMRDRPSCAAGSSDRC